MYGSFTHGLAMLVNSGTFGLNSDQAILRFLMDAGEAFYVWGINKEEERQMSKKEQK